MGNQPRVTMGAVGLAVTAVLVVVGAVCIVLSIAHDALIAALISVVPFAFWMAVRSHLNPLYISPLGMASLYWATIGVVGYTFRNEVANERGASIKLILADDVAQRTLGLLSAAATIVLLAGTLVARIMIAGRARLAVRPSQLTWSAGSAHPGLVVVAAVPLIAFIADVGLADFFVRNYYIVGERGSFVAAVVTQLATLAVVLLGYLVAVGSGLQRVAAVGVLIGYVLLMASFGSRRLALIPVLIALGFFLASNTRRTRGGLIVGGVLTAGLLPLPLEFRSNAEHGLIPYAISLANLDWSEIDWLGAANNVLVAFPIIGESAYGARPVSWSDLIVSMNPLPGEGAGWYEIYQRLRLNAFTPMAGIGEIGNVGWVAVVASFAIFAVGLAWLEVSVRDRALDGRMAYVGGLVGLSALFALQMTQYNLRQAARVLVYALILEAGRRLLALIRRRRLDRGRHVLQDVSDENQSFAAASPAEVSGLASPTSQRRVESA